MLKCMVTEVIGSPMGPTKMGNNSKMVNFDFFKEKSSNREGDDKALGKIMKTYADVYDKGSPDY